MTEETTAHPMTMRFKKIVPPKPRRDERINVKVYKDTPSTQLHGFSGNPKILREDIGVVKVCEGQLASLYGNEAFHLAAEDGHAVHCNIL